MLDRSVICCLHSGCGPLVWAWRTLHAFSLLAVFGYAAGAAAEIVVENDHARLELNEVTGAVDDLVVPGAGPNQGDLSLLAAPGPLCKLRFADRQPAEVSSTGLIVLLPGVYGIEFADAPDVVVWLAIEPMFGYFRLIWSGLSSPGVISFRFEEDPWWGRLGSTWRSASFDG